ncbi:MDR family MFS transporter [Salinithrix halophila]|uniref:MDR family MFS transporter n=1 Tax=Salinithrix halophila TaxID=1485204 RepID=A0ABV8JBI4_9BACL
MNDLEHLEMRQKVTIMIAVMTSMLFAALNQTIVGTSLPRIVSELGGMEYFNWVFTVFMLASSVTAVLVGKLSDIYGRKVFILTGLGLFMTGSFLCGTATEMIQLIAYRGVQGFGGGMIMSTAFTAVGDLFSPRERGRWQGLMGAVFGLASVLGPTLGGYIVDHFDWHWVFWIFLPFGIVAFILIWRMFPQTARGVKKKIDYIGSLFLVATIVPLLLAFTWAGRDYAWTSSLILGLFIASLAAFVLFILTERRAENPVMPLHLFQNNVFSLSNLINFLVGMGMYGAVMYMPFFIQGVIGTPATQTGFVMMSMTLAMVAASAITGQITTKTGKYKRLALIGLLIMGSGMYLLSTLDIKSTNWMAALYLIVVGLGLGTVFPIFTLTVQNAVSHKYLGVATSATQLFRQMGGTIGVSVMGSIMLTRMQEKMAESMPKGIPAGNHSALADQFQDPQILLSPDKLAQLKSQLPQAVTGIFDQLVLVMRESMGFALSGVFLVGMGLMLFALLLTLLLREIPLRTSNQETSGEEDGQEDDPSSSTKTHAHG